MAKRLSTDDVEKKHRLDYWQAVTGELIGSFELADFDPKDFQSHYDLSAVGDLKFGTFKGVSQTLHRKASLIRSSDADDYIVLLESDSRFVLDHCGHQRSGRGGIVLIDISRPYFSNHPEKLDVIDFFIPRQMLERALGPVRHAAGLAIDPSHPSFPVIASFLRSIVQHGANLDGASAERMSSIAVDLIAAGFAERIEHTHTMSGPALLCRAQAYIADHMSAAGLSIQEVAAAMNVSARRLHQVATDEGISLVDWMWEHRLLRASALLRDAANRAVSVATIAYNCGFVDQAHFSRRFKERFGQAPTDVRLAKAGMRLLQPGMTTP